MRRRSVLLTFLIFCAAGIVAGLTFAWLVLPAQPSGVTPERLNPADRELYIQLIADSFAANRDPGAAARRLDNLGPEAEGLLVAMIVRDLNGDRALPGVANLIYLATGLAIDAPVVELLALQPSIVPATAPVPAEGQDEDGPTPSVVAGGYVLVEQAVLCAAGENVNRIEIDIIEGNGKPLGGVPITVFWDGGRDSFFTGFTPGKNSGYADFTMVKEIAYAVAIAGDEVSATGLETQLCADGHDGGWQLAYQAR